MYSWLVGHTAVATMSFHHEMMLDVQAINPNMVWLPIKMIIVTMSSRNTMRELESAKNSRRCI